MSNDTTTVGFLRPTDVSGPVEDDALEDILQSIVVGITGMPGSTVRPRWVEDPAAEPEVGSDWCAIGLVDEDADPHPSVVHDGSADGGLGSDTMYRQETLTILSSFYGPSGRANAKLLRDGLYQSQNRDTIRGLGLAMVDVGRVLNAPEPLENQKWRKRVDLQFRVNRMVTRTFGVRNITSASGTIVPESGSDTPWKVEG
jgi:hypothetical protein